MHIILFVITQWVCICGIVYFIYCRVQAKIESMRRTKVLIPLPPLSVTIELKKKKKLKLLRRVMEKWLCFCYISSSNGRLPIKLEQEAQNIVNNSVSIRSFCYC